jgi:hypothetical protein
MPSARRSSSIGRLLAERHSSSATASLSAISPTGSANSAPLFSRTRRSDGEGGEEKRLARLTATTLFAQVSGTPRIGGLATTFRLHRRSEGCRSEVGTTLVRRKPRRDAGIQRAHQTGGARRRGVGPCAGRVGEATRGAVGLRRTAVADAFIPVARITASTPYGRSDGSCRKVTPFAESSQTSALAEVRSA